MEMSSEDVYLSGQSQVQISKNKNMETTFSRVKRFQANIANVLRSEHIFSFKFKQKTI